MSHMQKLSIRLLRPGLTPDKAVREGVALASWEKIDGSLIALDTLGRNAPKWADFLELSEKERESVFNSSSYGIVFINASDRWFAVSFGFGHVKLDPLGFEQDFGLRVVLNVVDPQQLKSADVRTPDENTLSRRTQTSRASDQTAFAIDVESDLVRGLAGTPKDDAFGAFVSGSDGLTLSRVLDIKELPSVCAETYAAYQQEEYKKAFAWIDQIRHVRDPSIIKELDAKLVLSLDGAVKNGGSDNLHLAFPAIYDPDKTSYLRYKGFRSWQLYSDLDLGGYLDALKERDQKQYVDGDLLTHTVHEVDDDGRDCGGKWRIRDCIVFETEYNEGKYVLSGGRWYQIDRDLAKEVQQFFDNARRVDLPEAEADETEEIYNKRVATLDLDMICLDRKLIKPTGASTPIEACDFFGRGREIIHIKDKTSSSRLSHLFSQGTVSARVLAIDATSRDSVRAEIAAVQHTSGQVGYENLLPAANEEFKRSDFTVVYGVIVGTEKPRLPFFSQVSFRQAARELEALGYNYAFSWIEKPSLIPKGKAKRTAKVIEPKAADVDV